MNGGWWLINIPGGKARPDVLVLPSKVPKPEDIVILAQPVLKALVKVGEGLKSVSAKWAVGGDTGEIVKGVNVNSDLIEILTTKGGADEIYKAMTEYQTLAPAEREERLSRDADVDGKMMPVYVKSRYAELTVGGVKVKIYGDEQIKVGEWDWGDPLDYEPEYVYVVGSKVPVVPLKLKNELYLGLGWLDRAELVSSALVRSQHRH